MTETKDLIVIEIDKQLFQAKLHRTKAPKTVEAFERILPYKSKIIHVRYSGESIWIPLPKDLPMATVLENQTSYPSKGEILYYPGFVSEKEILISYGATIFSSRVGILPGSHFASILDDHEKLAEIGSKILWEGAKDITIRNAP
jgi:hypothetical protein